MVFNQIGADTDKFIKRMALFSKSFSDIKKDLSNGLGLRQGLFSIVTAKDIKSFNDFNKAINNGIKYSDAFNTYMSKCPIAVKRQANELIKLHIAQSKLNTKLETGKITQEQYNTAMTANKAKMQALTTQTQSLTLSQKAATIASKGLSIAMNLLGNIAIMGIITLFSKGVKYLSDLVNNIEITKEKVDELTSTFKSALDEANSNAKRVEELADRYDELSDGVNNLGENVSLTNEEYEEYNSLVNEIADMFPTLVQGYTDEGNAILNLKGNVEELRDAYKEAQQEAYNLLITNGKDSDGNDIIKQWKDIFKSGGGLGTDKIGAGISMADAVEQLKAIQNMSAERYREIERIASSGTAKEIRAMSDVETDIAYGSYVQKALGLKWDISDKDFAEAKKQAKILVQTYNAEIESALSDVETLANAYLMTNDDYKQLDEQSKKAVSIMINSLDFDIASSFENKESVGQYVDNIIQSIKSNDEAQQALTNLFTMDTDNQSVGKIQSDVDKYINVIAQAIGENSDKLKIRLGFDDVDNELERAKNKFVYGKFNSKPILDFLEKLTPDELNIAVQIPDLFADGLEGATAKIKEWNKNPENAISFNIAEYQEDLENVYGNIDKLQGEISKLNEGKFDFSGDIKDLIKAFPEYSTEILNASGDTEQLRKVLQGLLNAQPNDLINSLTELKGSLASDEDIKAVDNLINILRNSTSVAYSVTSLSDSFQDLSDKESILSTVWKEMNDDGHISVSTYKSLCEMGEDYADTVINTNGVLTTTVDEIKKVIQKNYDLEMATKRAELAQLQYNAAVAGASGDDTSAYVKRITQLDNEIRAKEMQYQMFKSYDYTSDIKDKDDPWKDKAESKIKEIDHLYNMGEISHEEYINRLDAINQKYFANNTKYLDDFNKYEEEIYKARKDNEQDLFDQKIENLAKEKEKALENNDFSTAKTSINTQITETQKRIVELKTSGKQDVDDEIKQLEEDLDDLNDTLNEINSQEYEFNISVKEDSIEDLEKEFEKSGDTSIYDKQIEIYTGLIADAQNEIDRLINEENYSMDSEEIQNLKDQIEGYSEDIADIWEKQTDVIKDNVDEQIETLDRSIENTGDTKLYSEKIKVYRDGQQQILDMIEFYRKQGYAEDSAIIKELKKQWNDYQDSISDALQEQANAQVEAYNELLDEQKELLEQQKEAQDEYYDSEIKALEDKKKALEEVNETIEKQNELEEKRQSLAEAERNLYKNVRLVYTNGQWVQKAREEDLQAVKDAEKDISDTLRQQEIEALENQITALEDAKSEFDESIDKQITAIEESEKAFEKAMENSYKVRQQLDYEFISSIVGEDKAKEYQTNADNALKAINESEKTDNSSSDNTNTQTDNSALVDSNNAVTESNKEVADSNIQVAESNSKLGDIQGKGAERNVDTTDTQENTDTISPLEIDSETRVVFNTLLKKANAFLKNIPIEEFNKLLNNNLKSALDTAPKIADDVDKSKMVMNVVNNVTNAPVVNTTVNVDGRNKSDEEIANIVANTAESKVTQALTAFVQGANNRFTKMMYGNT